MLQQVGLHSQQATNYPHEFSGGQRQRIAVASALVSYPKLIVLDEPVSALDVSIRAQVMNLLKDLQEQYNVSYLLIAHNLATVRYMAHETAVMYLGQIVEYAETEELYNNALHPYTKALFSAALPSHPDLIREDIVPAGRGAFADQSAQRMPFPPTLSLRDAAMLGGDAGGERGCSGAPGFLPPVLIRRNAQAMSAAAKWQRRSFFVASVASLRQARYDRENVFPCQTERTGRLLDAEIVAVLGANDEELICDDRRNRDWRIAHENLPVHGAVIAVQGIQITAGIPEDKPVFHHQR